MWPLFSCLSTASRYFPQFELVYGVKTFPPADEAAVSCPPNLKLHVGAALCHRSKFAGSGRTLRPCIHLHSLDVWKHSVARPPSSDPSTNSLSISDKQQQQKRSFSRVKAAQPDMIHRWFALFKKQGPLAERFHLRIRKKANLWAIV